MLRIMVNEKDLVDPTSLARRGSLSGDYLGGAVTVACLESVRSSRDSNRQSKDDLGAITPPAAPDCDFPRMSTQSVPAEFKVKNETSGGVQVLCPVPWHSLSPCTPLLPPGGGVGAMGTLVLRRLRHLHRALWRTIWVPPPPLAKHGLVQARRPRVTVVLMVFLTMVFMVRNSTLGADCVLIVEGKRG